MPSYKDIFPDRWLRPDVIGPNRVRVTVERVTRESLFNPTAKKYEDRLIAKFRGKDLRLILNKTQCTSLESICQSDDFDRWQGKEIMLSTTRASNGKMTIVISPPSSQGEAPASRPAPTSTPQGEPEADDLWEPNAPANPDVNFYPDDNPAKAQTPDLVHGQGGQHENIGARPQGNQRENSGARPHNNTDKPCPACHAPVGRPHATSCTAMQENSVARPADPVARLEDRGARPQKSVQEEFDFDAEVYRQMASLYDSDMPLTEELTDYIRKARNADKDSAMKMSAAYLQSITSTLKAELSINDDEAAMVLTALVGYRMDNGARPGQLLHGYILKPIRDNDETVKKCLHELSDVCLMVFSDLAEGEMNGS